jgi:osmoprotectant transport system permease protein
MRKVCIFLLLMLSVSAMAQQPIRVGAKHFNEGYILSEMIALLLEDGGYVVERRFNLGGTTVAFEALRTNAIDVYPEYTGTLSAEILQDTSLSSLEAINTALQQHFGLRISDPYGFSNTYALIMTGDRADALAVTSISDLKKHPELAAGLSYEFLKRADGWDNLARAYHLPLKATGLEHGLAYQALRDGKIDVTDAYSTDGEIERYGLQLLEDDLGFFPDYQAVTLYRSTLPDSARQILDKLAGIIDEKAMQEMNAQALFQERTHRDIALEFLTQKGLLQANTNEAISTASDIFQHVVTHITLTLLSLLAAIAVALPSGIALYRLPRLSRVVLYFTGMLQTIPSIALLALMIPLLGIGIVPAVVALFLYALLPILRNTLVGLTTVDPQLRKVAYGLGMSNWQRLRYVELPLAVPGILTGIRTAAVINVGTATLAAFIGGGGLGEFIVTGLALNNINLILQGAIPAAILAIVIELIFELIEKMLVPRHLRQGFQQESRAL